MKHKSTWTAINFAGMEERNQGYGEEIKEKMKHASKWTAVNFTVMTLINFK